MYLSSYARNLISSTSLFLMSLSSMIGALVQPYRESDGSDPVSSEFASPREIFIDFPPIIPYPADHSIEAVHRRSEPMPTGAADPTAPGPDRPVPGARAALVFLLGI